MRSSGASASSPRSSSLPPDFFDESVVREATSLTGEKNTSPAPAGAAPESNASAERFRSPIVRFAASRFNATVPSPLHPWILAARPRTLGAAFVPVAAGAALAFADGAWHPGVTFLILLCALLIQIATNYFNDAIDFRKGADTDGRLGPLRVTAAGLLTPRQVMLGGAACLLAALALSIPLVLRGGWPIMAIGLASLLCAYLYTGGPFPLAYLGLGEVFVVLFFGLIAVAGTYYLNAREWSWISLLAGFPIGLHASVLLAVNNYRDIDGDRAAGKRTLAVRFGAAFARHELAFLVLAPFPLGLAWIAAGYGPAALLPLAALPWGLRLARAIHRTPPGRECNPLLARGAALHLAFGLLLAAGLALA